MHSRCFSCLVHAFFYVKEVLGPCLFGVRLESTGNLFFRVASGNCVCIQRLVDLRLLTDLLPNFTQFLHEDGHDDFSSFPRIWQSPV